MKRLLLCATIAILSVSAAQAQTRYFARVKILPAATSAASTGGTQGLSCSGWSGRYQYVYAPASAGRQHDSVDFGQTPVNFVPSAAFARAAAACEARAGSKLTPRSCHILHQGDVGGGNGYYTAYVSSLPPGSAADADLGEYAITPADHYSAACTGG